MNAREKAGAAGNFGEDAATATDTGKRERALGEPMHRSDVSHPDNNPASQAVTAPNAEHWVFAIRADVSAHDPHVRSLVATVCDCIEWRKQNPRCWGFIVSRCRELTAAGRHFGFRMVLEEARYHAAPSNGGGLFKLPNEYAPLLQRMACAEVPGMAKLVSMRKSKFDEILA